MYEYVTRAVVLEKRPVGERDVKVALFTEKLGKVEGRARSARKITSKLSAHLEPGTLAVVRIVENKGTHITDALKSSVVAMSLRDLSVLAGLCAAHQKDAALWGLLTGGNFSWSRALAALGFAPRHASCAACGGNRIAAFYAPRQEFYCASCLASSEMLAHDIIDM